MFKHFENFTLKKYFLLIKVDFMSIKTFFVVGGGMK